MFVSLFNCTGENELYYGYVGEEDEGGYFFEMPRGLYPVYGHVQGSTTEAEVDRVISTFDADEIDRPSDDFDRDAAEAEVRRVLARYVRDEAEVA